ncbi:MAG: hypothetical protein CMP59_03945 [Flavobacteriales bacterium]|nr:hypothetical protein [Flavobacteriales bacterium]
MKIVYCGFGRAGLECFYQLIGHFKAEPKDILVFTHEAAENAEFIKHLDNLGVKYLYSSVNDHLDEIKEFKAEYLLSVYYRYIIKGSIIDLVNARSMNLHPSLLPAYRGTKSSVWALLNHEEETGISFHYINEKIDDGKLILQEKVKIDESDTAYSLYHKLIGVFSRNFNKAFQLLIDGYKGEEQKGEASYYPRKLPFDGKRVLSEINEKEAIAFIKAMYFPPFKGAIFELPTGELVEIQDKNDLEPYKAYLKD